jgi:hypothetical protein
MMMPRQRGQAASEYLVCAALLAAVLFLPVLEGASVSSLLARRLTQFFHGFHALLALA